MRISDWSSDVCSSDLVVEYYRSNPQAQAQLRAPLFEDKVIDFIIDLAKVTERDVTADELREEEEKAAEEKPKTAAKPKAKKAATKAKGAKAKGAEGEDRKSTRLNSSH